MFLKVMLTGTLMSLITLTVSAQSTDLTHPPQIQQSGGCMKVLNDLTEAQAASYNASIRQMANNANNAYAHSMPVLAYALSNNQSDYKASQKEFLDALGLSYEEVNKTLDEDDLENLTTALKTAEIKAGVEANTYAWLLGRALIAADAIGDTYVAKSTARILEAYLIDPKTPANSRAAWAWGYLNSYTATADKAKYEQYKQTMMDITHQVVHNTDNLSDKLWARAMTLYATAQAGDRTNYQTTLGGAATDTGVYIPVFAFEKIPEDDYRAWANSIVALSAAKMADEKAYNTAKVNANTAIGTTNDINNRTLAQLTVKLAEQCATQLFDRQPAPAMQNTLTS